MDIIKLTEMLAMSSVLISCVLYAIPLRVGILVSTIGQILWITYGCLKGMEFLIIQSVVIIGMNIYANYSWKKKNIPMFRYKK
jgi:hypothetical protein